MGWTGLIVLKICDKFDFLQKGDPNTVQSQHYPPGDVELLWPERRYSLSDVKKGWQMMTIDLHRASAILNPYLLREICYVMEGMIM